MATAKVIVIYPWPKDVDAFEKVYTQEHVPLAAEKIKGLTKFAASKVLGAPDGGTPPFYRIAELYFASMEGLQQSVASAGTQEAVAHAFKISSGGPPIILVTEEETMQF